MVKRLLIPILIGLSWCIFTYILILWGPDLMPQPLVAPCWAVVSFLYVVGFIGYFDSIKYK